ncbi:MAG: SpoIIE family protein phosphatase [Bacteroidales bacterium]|nr:SpoIIE family protein phosphatase [Bacteroidales bacterium]
MIKVAVFLFLIFNYIFTWAQWIQQPIKNFTSKHYGVQYSNYIHSVTIDKNGFLYAGSAYGILQFDGYRWNFIPVRSGTYVTSLTFANDNIYVGCTNDFGYLKANKNGFWEYESLAEKHKINLINPIWKILVLNNKIYFQTDEAIYIYDKKTIVPIKPQTSFHLAFKVDDKIVVRERNEGLLQISSKGMVFIPHSQTFANIGVFAILPFKKYSKIIITQEDGFFEWKQDTFVPILSKQQKEFFVNAMIIGAQRLADGNIALFTIKNGVIVIDTNLSVVAHYTSTQGLLSNEIHDLVQDYYGNLWLATQKGISQVQYTSYISYLNEKLGLTGNVYCINKFNGNLFIGTTDGLFEMENANKKTFKEIKEIKNAVWSIVSNKKNMWFASDQGLWKMELSGITKQISKEPYTSLVLLDHLNQLLTIGINGTKLFDCNSNKLIQHWTDLKVNAYGAVVQKEKNAHIVWIGSKNQGVFQLILNKSNNNQVIHYKGLEDGLPNDWICPYALYNDILFATATGFLKFISPQEIKQITGDTLNNEVKGYFDVINYPKNIKGKSITAVEARQNDSYIAIENYLYHVNNDSIADNRWFKTIDLGRLNYIMTTDSEIWIGADDGLARIDKLKLNKFNLQKPQFTISSIEISNDSVLGFWSPLNVNNTLTLPFNLNSIKINLSSLYIDNNSTLLYSWRLKGSNDESFSLWNNHSQIALNNLNEGEYTLFIRAKNAQNVLSDEVTLFIKILPPWYRSWWAYLIYFLMAALFIYLIVYFNSQRLIAKNKKLEELVKLRTQEVVKQKEEIEHQKTTIEHILKDLNDSISYAQRIQQALLPSREMIESLFPNSMVLFKPRNIVSGDFYWAASITSPKSKEEIIVITVADCTGHGIPGAFMSMLGISFLNDIVKKKEITIPSEILNILRTYIIEALKQTINLNSQKDGMDIALIAINKTTLQCQFAGANNPLYLVKKIENESSSAHQPFFLSSHQITNSLTHQLIEYKGNKMPVAIYEHMEDFTNHEIQLQQGDMLYLFSDGYADQFGGEHGKKFMYKRFKELILANAHKPMNEQKQAFEETIVQWIGNEEQTDDITVVGIKIN